jgi:hypothetical protein
MAMRKMSSPAAALLCAAIVFTGCMREPLPAFPGVILWAWESPQDLSFIDPHDAGVAFLARTIVIGNGRITVLPRVQPLHVPPGTVLMAVVRIESPGRDLPDPGALVPPIAEAARLAGVKALQIDFDARSSERGFYRDLIGRLRNQLPADVPLTMTALVSWCRYDNWIAGLPVAEAVPMLFRMGPDRYQPGEKFRDGLCRNSIGISTDEPIMKLPRVRRVYIFHPGSWSKADYQNAFQEVKRWI